MEADDARAVPMPQIGNRSIQVVYDGSCRTCLRVMHYVQSFQHRLEKSGASAIVELHERQSREAEEVLRNMPQLQRQALTNGQIVARLPSGLILPGCETEVAALIYEMEYLAFVQLPTPAVAMRIEHTIYSALREARQLACHDNLPWWQRPHVYGLLAHGLRSEHFCILDDFLPDDIIQELQATACKGRPNMVRGATEQAGSLFELEGYTKDLDRALRDPSRGDVVLFSNDHEHRGCAGLSLAMDALVSGLQGCEEVAERLRYVDWANSAMFATYPGDASRYVKHVDNLTGTDGRRLTLIVYLNKDWTQEDGGCLRIFEPPLSSYQVKHDVEPRWNRLLLFWSTDEVPHEVLSTYKDRTAVSVWYFCGREGLGNSEAFQDLFDTKKFRCIAERDRTECIARAARTEEQRTALAQLLPDSTLTKVQLQDLGALFGWQTRKRKLDEYGSAEAEQGSSSTGMIPSRSAEVVLPQPSVEASSEAWSIFD